MKAGTTVRKTLKKLRPKLPDAVADLRFELGQDSTGDDAIWVWIEIPDDAPEEIWKWDSRRSMRTAIRSALGAAGLEPWVYIRFTEPTLEAG